MKRQQQPELIELRFDEDALARAIGISVEHVQEKRRTKIPRDEWEITHGHISYTREGVVGVIEALGLKLPIQKKGAAPDVWGRPSIEDVLERSVIGPNIEHAGCERFTTMGPMPDPRKLLACRLSDGFGCTVLVPSNANFTIGMEFIGRLVNQSAAVYELVGAAPRWRGRW